MSVELSLLERRLFAPGPKRILALDGGGLSAALTAGILVSVEAQLRRLSGRADFRLCDYFDLIGASSSGAILAAGLALGGSAAQAGELFRQCSFSPDPQPGAARFDAAKLDAFLSEALGDADFGSNALRTGLAIFTKQTEEAPVVAINNSPRGAPWQATPSARDFLLRNTIHASLGGPAIFETAHVALDPYGQATARFLDAQCGGVGNPALALLKLVTLGGQGFEWHSGPDRILMLSVGAGLRATSETSDKKTAALSAMIRDSGQDVVATMQGVANVARRWAIAGETDPVHGAPLSPVPLLHYQRMDVRFDRATLTALGEPEADISGLVAGAAPPPERLHQIGVRAGQLYFESDPEKRKRRWDRAIFPRRFDPPGFTGGPVAPPKFKLEALRRAWSD